MVTYYHDKSIQVTSTAVRVADDTFPLAEISTVWHHRGSRSWRVLAGRGAIGAALAGPMVAAGAGIALALWLDRSTTVTMAIIGASVLAGLAIGPVADFLFEHLDRSYARGSRRLEIWVRWRGQPVRLVATSDALRFGQIYRAVQRAVEATHPANQPQHPLPPSRSGHPDRSPATNP
ncbi:DUF6232 family protein [Salinispora arenicola]|uniref:Uncharacterized protein n=1 Tax=Salinispora arenicola TaxID=168697 RepID=A0A542XH25_SALAC|nr:DUF6232 family protein [Salinispora arenicola]TQL35122.1 hypothetical protein FB564_0144 [Salinispora arenicola]GIM83239.1 hypothetical protein Sar04_11230 [Salinispora arenicola]